MFAAYDSAMMAFGGLAWVLFGLLILIVLRCLPLSSKPPGRRFGRLFFTVLGWLFVGVGLLLSLCFFGALIFGGQQGPIIPRNADRAGNQALVAIGLLFLPAVLVFVVAALVFARRRRLRQQTLLCTLAVAAERSIPLTQAIEAYAKERSYLAGHEIRMLARLLNAGMPLPQALSAVPGMVPEEAVTPMYVGQEVGALDEGLRRTAATVGSRDAVWDQLAGKVAYLCFVIVFAFSVAAYMAIEVVPRFERIFVEFGAQLPAISRIGIALTARFGFVIVPASALLLFLMVYAILRYVGSISWDLPLMDRFSRKFQAARVLDSLAIAAERNQPLPRIIATLVQCHPGRSMRYRLEAIRTRITSGIDLAEAMRTCGLISSADAAVLSAAQRVGNLAWAMREIADSNRRRLAYRVQTWMQILFPAAVVCFGLTVLFFWLSYFLPLIVLIQKLR